MNIHSSKVEHSKQGSVFRQCYDCNICLSKAQTTTAYIRNKRFLQQLLTSCTIFSLHIVFYRQLCSENNSLALGNVIRVDATKYSQRPTISFFACSSLPLNVDGAVRVRMKPFALLILDCCIEAICNIKIMTPND